MPAKSKSPEAAQRKVWKAELKTLESNRRKAAKDFDLAEKAAMAVVRTTEKASQAAKGKLIALRERHKKTRPRALAKFDSRVAVLRGRLGL